MGKTNPNHMKIYFANKILLFIFHCLFKKTIKIIKMRKKSFGALDHCVDVYTGFSAGQHDALGHCV